MYLFFGQTDDALCLNLRQALEERGLQVRVFSDPFAESIRFSWRVGSSSMSSTLVFEDGTRLVDREISGILLRRTEALATARTNPDDRRYIRAEIEAATLGWIWALPCPVVNRVPAWLWYDQRPPARFWSRLLWTHGLQEVRCSERETELSDLDGFGSLDSAVPSPVYCRACVIGSAVVWNFARPANLYGYENALIEFTRCAGLSFLEVAFAKTSEGTGVKELDPFPDLNRFCGSSACAITETLVALFTDSNWKSH